MFDQFDFFLEHPVLPICTFFYQLSLITHDTDSLNICLLLHCEKATPERLGTKKQKNGQIKDESGGFIKAAAAAAASTAAGSKL